MLLHKYACAAENIFSCSCMPVLITFVFSRACQECFAGRSCSEPRTTTWSCILCERALYYDYVHVSSNALFTFIAPQHLKELALLVIAYYFTLSFGHFVDITE